MLNLVKIELRGFKSFADKIEIPFQEGVTAIIGPNGCGKSNVSDAIRWTLCERSAKQLRGKSMQDVIFSGTEKRKSQSYCEVALYFNNDHQHIFPGVSFDEVVIKRTMDRSGHSDYYINNNLVRMKDVINLLHDTGIGKEGYSLIGQGRVAEIMSADPAERRGVFEEAAGIAKFRADKEEAERKLEKARLNLQTSNEVIAEIERQIKPLERQAEAAQKYLELKEQLKYNEVNAYIYNYDKNKAVKQKWTDELDSISSQVRVKQFTLDEKTKEFEACRQEALALDKVYDDATTELMALKVDATRIEGEANLFKERLQNLQEDKQSVELDLKELDERLDKVAKAIENAQTEKDEKFKEYLEVAKQLKVAQENADAARGNKSILEAKNLDYLSAMERLNELRGNMDSMLTQKGILEQSYSQINELIEEKERLYNEAKTNFTIYDGNNKANRERLKDLSTKYNEALSNKKEAEESIGSYSADLNSLKGKLAQSEANLSFSIRIKEEYAAYQDSVKRLMKDVKDVDYVKDRVMGVVAESISVPERYMSAIEYALGGAMQHIIVESERDAADLITYLKQKGYGRVTFRPLTSCKDNQLDPSERRILDEPGVEGLASSLVTYDKRFDKLIQTLLGTTVVVNNVENAKNLYVKYNRQIKIATLDGDIFTRGGEITGGTRKNQGSTILAQEQQIEANQKAVERLRNNIATFEKQSVSATQDVEKYAKELEEISKQTNELRISLQLDLEKANQSKDTYERLEKEIETHKDDFIQIKNDLQDVNSQLSQIDELKKVTDEKKGEYEKAKSEGKVVEVKQEERHETEEDILTKVKIKEAQAKMSFNEIEKNLSRLISDKEGWESEKLELIAELKAIQENIDQMIGTPEKSEFSEEDIKKIKYLEESIETFKQKKQELSDKTQELDATKTAIFNELNQFTETKANLENRLANLEETMLNLERYMLEEYDLTYAGCLELKDENFVGHGSKETILEIKRSISRLGEVNPLALETLNETKQRLDEQVKQRDDIQKAHDDIVKIIEEITGEMTDKFITAFNQINENFKDIFVRLFEGGKAELKLNTKENEDVLSCGIDIMAQPPGKALKSLSLLSGGEQALTAIAILFSILKLKPMPFCVLDEIDAALDEGNVGLFADFLCKFSDYTQFIVITHRKGTMERADSIFGVTMEEKGVTKLVSVSFEEASKISVEEK